MISKFLKISAFVLKQDKLLNRLIFFLTAILIFSSYKTYIAIFGKSLINIPNPKNVIFWLLCDLTILMLIVLIASRKIFKIIVINKIKQRGYRLQSQILTMFALISIIPTILVTIFSTLSFNFGVQTWFDQRVSTALDESVKVAEAYFKEHLLSIRSDILNISRDIDNLANVFLGDDIKFKQYLDQMAVDRSLIEIILFKEFSHTIIAKSRFSYPFFSLSESSMNEAKNGNIVILNEEGENKVRALVRLNSLPETYLLIGRLIDNKVLEHMEKTQGAHSEFENLRSEISTLQIQFFLVFLVFSLLLLIVSIASGIILASRISAPLNKLLSATGKIRKGNFDISIPVGHKNDEFAILGKAFNIMAMQLAVSRNELIRANQQIDLRRHFFETVLSNVSAGVIALDNNFMVSTANPSAARFLDMNIESMKGQYIFTILPELKQLIGGAEKINVPIQSQITINRENREIILLIRIIEEKVGDISQGIVITFDDITELIMAQKNMAWSEVARRIAHEIKNPLTPIHLATQRLKKKYADKVDEPENFLKYIDTVDRHVKDISRMVEEFVNFARMPAPIFEEVNLSQLISDIIFSRENNDKNIIYKLDLPEDPILYQCDSGQIGQALTNIMKNAEEAIVTNNVTGIIEVNLARKNNCIILTIRDNGGGFVPNMIGKVIEPYITTKNSGTGLGLAIVKKILDDHHANLQIYNDPENRAVVEISFR